MQKETRLLNEFTRNKNEVESLRGTHVITINFIFLLINHYWSRAWERIFGFCGVHTTSIMHICTHAISTRMSNKIWASDEQLITHQNHAHNFIFFQIIHIIFLIASINIFTLQFQTAAHEWEREITSKLHNRTFFSAAAFLLQL